MFNAISKLWSSQVGFPFDAAKVELDPAQPLQVHLNEIFTEIKYIHSQDKELVQSVEQAHQGCIFLLKIAPLYDYHPSIQANGYWSFAKLIIKIGKIILVTSTENTSNREQIINVLHVN